MLKPKGLLLLLILIFSGALLSSSRYWKQAKGRIGTIPEEHLRSPGYKEKMQAKASEARMFIEKNRYNESICFLVDMSLPSGQNRFFVYNLKKDSLVSSGLVTHGNCNQYWLDGRKYDNVVGCGCTSLGKYKIGNSYAGRFGLAFKLFGLDKTNDKAFARYVVLHSHSCVPETEVKDEICQSNGCPTVSPGFLWKLKSIVHQSKKPVLLWIYE
ncbi:MAG: murein L,D-transpeptidase catalytic domain-containing protein [Chitinophagales bacterium]